jgi:hypothetical protein
MSSLFPPPRPTEPPLPRSTGFVRRTRWKRRGTPLRPCANCGDHTPGNYCPVCGQRKVEVAVSLQRMLMEALDDQFSLNSALPRTIGALFFRPGHLSREYMAGRIARYIPPFRLYLLSSVIFFVVVSLTAGFSGLAVVSLSDDSPAGARAAPNAAPAAQDRAAAPLAGIPAVADGATVPAAVAGDSVAAPAISPAPADSAAAPNAAAGAGDSASAQGAGAAGEDAPVEGESSADSAAAGAGTSAPAAAAAAAAAAVPGDGVAARMASDSAGQEVVTVEPREDWTESMRFRTGIRELDDMANQRIAKFSGRTPDEAWREVFSEFLEHAPTMMFALLPVFAGVLKLIYWRRKRFYVEHFVFALHVHAFVFLTFAVSLISQHEAVNLLLTLWAMLYIYLAMKRFYGQGWVRTAGKYVLVGMLYNTILGIAFGVTMLLSLLLI